MKCKACKLTPPLRAYHCSICQACITRYEFHSILFMTCIGARNSVPYIIFWINEILDCIGIFSLLIINISHDFGDHIGPLIIFAIFFAIYTKVVIDCLWSAIRSMAENLTYNERQMAANNPIYMDMCNRFVNVFDRGFCKNTIEYLIPFWNMITCRMCSSS